MYAIAELPCVLLASDGETVTPNGYSRSGSSQRAPPSPSGWRDVGCQSRYAQPWRPERRRRLRRGGRPFLCTSEWRWDRWTEILPSCKGSGRSQLSRPEELTDPYVLTALSCLILSASPLKSSRKVAWEPVVPWAPRNWSLSLTVSMSSRSIMSSWIHWAARLPCENKG